jgi:hypothetical protein
VPLAESLENGAEDCLNRRQLVWGWGVNDENEFVWGGCRDD